MKKASRFHVNEADLLCQNKCGFYGNPAWNGYCSVCYNKLSGKKRQSSELKFGSPPQTTEQTKRPNIVVSTASGSRKSSHVVDKKRVTPESKSLTVKSIFQKSRSRERTPERNDRNSATPEPDASEEKARAFSTFLKSLGHEIHQDMYRRVNSFANKFKVLARGSTVDQWSDIIQDFYISVEDSMNDSHLYSGLTENQTIELMDLLEEYLMTKLYPFLHSPLICDDEQLNRALQNRITSLKWITLQQLEANISENDLGVRASIFQAEEHITLLDTKPNPKEKLDCIVACSRSIFEALTLSKESKSNSVPSADDFLPVFIFVILKANPSCLQSNINYITRFARPSRLNSGEGGYFFTNLCCTVSFIEKINADSLNLKEEEFDDFMSLERQPEGTSTQDLYYGDGLRIMHENSIMIEKLKEKQAKSMKSLQDLEERMTHFRHQFDSEINDLVTNSPLSFNLNKTKVDLDESPGDMPELPQPLMPQAVKES